MADKPTSTVNFRKLLLNRCQKEFEKDKVNDDVFEKKQRELEAAASVSVVPLKRLSFHFFQFTYLSDFKKAAEIANDASSR